MAHVRSYRSHDGAYSVLFADGTFSVFHSDDHCLLWGCNIAPFTFHPLLYRNAFIIPLHEYLWGTSLSWNCVPIDVPVKAITHLYLTDEQLGVLDASGQKHTFPLSLR